MLDMTNSEPDSDSEYNTDRSFLNTFEFKVLEYIFKYRPY